MVLVLGLAASFAKLGVSQRGKVNVVTFFCGLMTQSEPNSQEVLFFSVGGSDNQDMLQ